MRDIYKRMAMTLILVLPGCSEDCGDDEPPVDASPVDAPPADALPVDVCWPSPGPEEASVVEKAGCGSCCEDWGCGANTAQIDNHPLNPINTVDERGVSTFRLVPNSLTLSSGTIAHLEIHNGEFVGVDPEGNRITGCDPLKGAEFKIEQDTGQVWTIQIENVGKVKSFVSPRTSDGPEYITAYELVYSLDEQKFSYACPCARTFGFEHQNDEQLPPRIDGCDTIAVQDAGHYAVLIKGETYNRDTGQVDIKGYGDGSEPWFNVACSGAALSKMVLMGYNPEDGITTWNQRQATLNMITARYCQGVHSFTTDGTPLDWQNSRRWFPSIPTSSIEARWDENGATCLTMPRHLEKMAAIEEKCPMGFPPCPPHSSGEEWESFLPLP